MNQPSTYSNEINEAISRAGFAEVLTLEKWILVQFKKDPQKRLTAQDLSLMFCGWLWGNNVPTSLSYGQLSSAVMRTLDRLVFTRDLEEHLDIYSWNFNKGVAE